MDTGKASTAEQIAAIANETRSWAEQYAIEHNFSTYTLQGMCAIVSAELHRRLKQSLIRSYICYNKGHCFVMVGEFVIDLTATQFRSEKILKHRVLIEKHSKLLSTHEWAYKIVEKYSGPGQLRFRQKNDRWPRTMWARKT